MIAEGAIIGYLAVFGTQTSTVRSDPMPKKSIEEWETDKRGNYPRKVGKWRNNAGKIAPKRFKFGKNIAQAKARLARVEELWSFVVEAASDREQERAAPSNPYSYDPPIAQQPIWNGEPLWIAFELAKGKVQIEFPRAEGESENSYALKVNGLAATFPCVVFVPENSQAFDDGRTEAESSTTSGEH